MGQSPPGPRAESHESPMLVAEAVEPLTGEGVTAQDGVAHELSRIALLDDGDRRSIARQWCDLAAASGLDPLPVVRLAVDRLRTKARDSRGEWKASSVIRWLDLVVAERLSRIGPPTRREGAPESGRRRPPQAFGPKRRALLDEQSDQALLIQDALESAAKPAAPAPTVQKAHPRDLGLHGVGAVAKVVLAGARTGGTT